MGELQAEIAAWISATFPHSTTSGLIQHFREEVAELIEELEVQEPDEQNLREECADVMHFLFQIAGRHGFDLMEETRRKFEINKTRTWAASDDGIVRHVKPEASV
ncbi:MAG TPA: dATP/dGTP pyrophosphohydrolase domain-containing protein [Thermomicrobiales bacterium]|nr:dATP/dGTP pyrophosphohydrolase domain-containing protein [Thermomicrobiales bacterium]